eukprot:scaffold3776_cov166-Ochromonas_danica.AAC.10
MFSLFRSRASTAVSKAEVKKEDEDNDSDRGGSEDSDDGAPHVDLHVETGSGKGWPDDATVVMYHNLMGLICVGTEGGSVYLFGDGFQYMRPWLTADPNEVLSIVAVYPNKILVAFADNSIAVMELPTLNIIDLLPPNWMGNRAGEITALHCDLPSEKPFVFVGTSEGNVFVLDVMESAVRICDFSLGLVEFNLSGETLAVADLHLSPKDERYLTIGLSCRDDFDNRRADQGAIVIFDLLKNKVMKNIKVPSVTSLAWHHSSELLFAATRKGEIYAIQPDKGTSVVCWESTDEVINIEDEEGGVAAVRRIHWLAPQCNSNEASSGADNDNLKNVIVGLAMLGGSRGEMHTVFALPPIQGEKVLNFRLLPTINKNDEEVVPALLLLTERHLEDQTAIHSLRLSRCPSTAITEWAIEIGTLPDPRLAFEVLPGETNVSFLYGIAPSFSNPLSLSQSLQDCVLGDEGKIVQTTLLQRPPSTEDLVNQFTSQVGLTARASRRLSAKDFFSANLAGLSVESLERQFRDRSWELVLASGQHEVHSNKENGFANRDVVFVGYQDGTIVAFAVSQPEGGQEIGRGEVWLPLTALRCATTSITAIQGDPRCGLVAAGDEAGFFVLYELRDDSTELGAVDVINQVGERLKSEADILSADIVKLCNIHDFHEEQLLKQFMLYDDNHFSSLKEVYRTKLPRRITSILVLGALQRVYVGLEDGSLYFSDDLRLDSLNKVQMEENSESGALLAFHLSYVPNQDQLLPVVFAYFASGRLVGCDVLTGRVILTITALKVLDMFRGEEENHGESRVTASCALLANGSLASPPATEAILYIASRAKNMAESSPRASEADAAGESASPTPSPPAPPIAAVEEQRSSFRRTFFGRVTVSKTSPPPPPPTLSPVPISSDKNRADQSPTPPPPPPRNIDFDRAQIPTKLCFLHGRFLVTFDLRKVGNLMGKKKESFAVMTEMATASSVKEVSDKQIVTARSLLFSSVENDTPREEITSWSHYLACVDKEGLLRLLAPGSTKVVCEANLLEGVLEDSSIELTKGSVLPNGSIYLLQRNSLLLSTTFQSPDSILSAVPPDRASTTAGKVDPRNFLLHGRESTISQSKAALKKRRSSVISLSSAPTDLYKIFAKTRDQRQRDELLSSSDVEEEEVVTSAKRSNQKTQKVIHTEMHQLKDSLEERGEKINRITLKMENFKQSAADFRATARAQREKLQQKNNRWGLF